MRHPGWRPERLWGHIDSISRGITDWDNSRGPELLTNVTPTFEWVHLTQRIAGASVQSADVQ
jgi:multidrug resistance efflux pump